MYNYFASAHLVLVVPEYVGGRLRGELDEASEVDGGAHVHVQVGPAQDARRRHWNRRARHAIRYICFYNVATLLKFLSFDGNRPKGTILIGSSKTVNLSVVCKLQ